MDKIKTADIADGSTISYYVEGSLSKPTIMMLSGSIFNYKQFFPIFLPALKKQLGDDYSYLLYDYVGISHSSELEGEFDFLTIVRQHVELMDVLGIESAHHFGISKGSLISFLVTAQSPNRVLTVSGYGNPNIGLVHEETKSNFNRRRQSLASISGTWDQRIQDRNFDVVYDAVFLPMVFPGKSLKTIGLKEKAQNKIIKSKIKPLLMNTKVGVLEKLYRYYTQDANEEEMKRYEEAMKGITTPSLLMHGDIDDVIPIAASEKLHSWIEGSKFEIFEGFDHTAPVLDKKKGTAVMSKLATFIQSNS